MSATGAPEEASDDWCFSDDDAGTEHGPHMMERDRLREESKLRDVRGARGTSDA